MSAPRPQSHQVGRSAGHRQLSLDNSPPRTCALYADTQRQSRERPEQYFSASEFSTVRSGPPATRAKTLGPTLAKVLNKEGGKLIKTKRICSTSAYSFFKQYISGGTSTLLFHFQSPTLGFLNNSCLGTSASRHFPSLPAPGTPDQSHHIIITPLIS